MRMQCIMLYYRYYLYYSFCIYYKQRKKFINSLVKMIKNLLNKSINAMYQSFTTPIPRPKITFLKLTYVRYTESIELPSILSVFQNVLHLFYLQNLPKVEFKLYCKYQVQEQINQVHSINHISAFADNLPVIAVYGMGDTNEIKFISLKSKTIIKVIQLTSPLISISFHKKYFGIACKDGCIRIYDNNVLSQNECVPIYHITQYKISKVISKETIKEDTNTNTNKQYNIDFDMSDNCIMYHISSFDINKETTNTHQHQQEVSTWTNTSSNCNNDNNKNTLESFAIGAYRGIKDFTNWGMKSISDYNTLLKSKKASSNQEMHSLSSKAFRLNKQNTQTIVNVFNISNSYKTNSKQNNNSSQIDINTFPYQIHIPQFKDGISSIKQIQNGKYIIIGNFHSQVFYIFELYPQTNKKYNINYTNNTSNRYKVVYSLFRGITKCKLTSIDLNTNNNFSIITSNKGTNHLYYLPQRDNQINENIDNVNITNDDLLNLKINEGNEIAKYNYDYYYTQNTNETNSNISLYDSKFIIIDKIAIDDNNFTNTNYNKLLHIYKDKHSPYIQNGNYLFMITDDKVNVVLIINKNTLIPLNTFNLNYEESNENIRLNVTMLIKQFSFNNVNDKEDNNLILDHTTTDLSNFPAYQTNPLFTFNKVEHNESFIKSNLDSSRFKELFIQIAIQLEIVNDKFNALYIGVNYQSELNILNELCLEENKYVSLKNERKGSELGNDMYNGNTNEEEVLIKKSFEDLRSSVNSNKDIKFNEKNALIENNIKQALTSNIHDLIKTSNSIIIQGKVVMKENYY